MSKTARPPRLLISKAQFDSVAKPPTTPLARLSDKWIKRHAMQWLPTETVLPPAGHNGHLLRARELQNRVITLLVRWRQTGEQRFLSSAVRHIEQMGEWQHWSWGAMRDGMNDPADIFDLSYGENSATLALAYDLAYEALSEAERAMFVQIARRWSIASGMVHCKSKEDGGTAWWFGSPNSNWNAVCAGGLGMVCLSMREELEEADFLLGQVETSLAPFMKQLDATDGGWPEGVGYWNYGMRYAFFYLLSSERATGEKHPLLRRPATKRTLSFPLDFSPSGCSAGFGDANAWVPMPFHYLAARRLGVAGARRALEGRLAWQNLSLVADAWALAPWWRVVDPPYLPNKSGGAAASGSIKTANHRRAAKPGKTVTLSHYKGLDWMVLRSPGGDDRGAVTIRGGTGDVPHAHADLTSFNYVLKGEMVLGNQGNTEYLDTTFSRRRFDLPDINAQYKNVLFLDGVGIMPNTTLEPARVRDRGKTVVLSGTSIFGRTEPKGSPFELYERCFHSLDHDLFLVVDILRSKFPVRVEARHHTLLACELLEAGVLLRGARVKAAAHFAASQPALLVTATTAPTTPRQQPATMLRWCCEQLVQGVCLATLLAPSHRKMALTISEVGRDKYVIGIKGRGIDIALKTEVRPAAQ